MTDPASLHTPVLLDTLLKLLEFPADGVLVDATVGQAGHARALGERLDENGLLIGLDVDEKSLAIAGENLAGLVCRVELIRENFGGIDKVLSDRQSGAGQVDLILADLGISSGQLADVERGISFQIDGVLDMRLDDRLKKTAADLVNRLRQDNLADLIYKYGEERKSRRIARAIVEARRKKRIERTGELVDVIFRSLGIAGKGRKSKIHPATRTFQALRIAVNDELRQLERLLEAGPRLLKPGGQIAIISFHSLEDRIVKYNFRENQTNDCYEILTKKPIQAGEDERKKNPRSRSAKLRIARRVES